jgi:hypothetical protein
LKRAAPANLPAPNRHGDPGDVEAPRDRSERAAGPRTIQFSLRYRF